MPTEFFSSRARLVWLVVVLATVAGIRLAAVASDASQPKSERDDAPWKRMLKGEDAKRVEALEKKIAELRRASMFTEAIAPAKTVADIRNRAQGGDHWQTGDAQRLIALLERLANLPPKARAGIAESVRLDDQASAAFAKAHYGQAEALHRRALEIVERHLGQGNRIKSAGDYSAGG
jgi:hypothetical protein